MQALTPNARQFVTREKNPVLVLSKIKEIARYYKQRAIFLGKILSVTNIGKDS